MNDIDYLRLFESLPHCDSMCNIVEDWGYAPNLYYFDQEWHVSWVVEFQHKELAHNIMLDYYELARHDYNITKIKNKTL